MSSTNDPTLLDQGKTTLEDLLNSVATYTAGVKSTEGAVSDAISQQQSLANNTATILSQVSTDNSTVSLTQSAAEMDAQARRARVAAILGTDVNATNSQYQHLSDIANKAQADKEAALNIIQQKQSVGLFDNPLQYIMNGLTINTDIAKHNIADATLDSAHNRILQLDAESSGAFLVQNQLVAGTTTASAEAAARVAASNAATQANNAKITGLQYGISGIQAANNAGKEVYSALYTAENAIKAQRALEMQTKNLDLARQQFAEHIREFNINDELRQQQASDRQDVIAAGQNFVDSINKGRVARGVPELDDVGAKTVLSYFKTGKGSINDAMQHDYSVGEVMRMKGGDQQIVATSPSDLVTTLAKGIPVNFTPAQVPIKDIVSQTANEVTSPVAADPTSQKFAQDFAAARASKDINAMSNLVNARVQAKFDAKAANINPQDASNPYNILSINALAEQSATVANLPVYQKVFKPRAEAGEQLNDPNKIFDAVSTALQNKTITFPEALELSTIYQVGVGNNIAQRNMQGVAGVTPKLSYNSTVQLDKDKFSSSKVIDFTKPDALARALVLSLRSKAAGGYMYTDRRFNGEN